MEVRIRGKGVGMTKIPIDSSVPRVQWGLERGGDDRDEEGEMIATQALFVSLTSTYCFEC